MYINKVFDPIQSKMYVWDTDVLDWVAWAGGTSGTGPGTEVEVTNWPSSQAISDGGGSITIDGSISVSKSSGLALRLDEATSTVTYVGEALAGTVDGVAGWRIKKIDTTSGISILWASGVEDMTKRWDQRLLYEYS